MGITQFVAGQEITAADLNSLPVVVSYLTTGSVSNSNAETVIGTFTIPAGDPTSPGGYYFKLWMTGTATGSPSFTGRLRLTGLAGTLLASGANTASTSPFVNALEGWLGFEAIGSSGTFGLWVNFADNQTGSVASSVALNDAVAINTTVANTIVFTAQFGTANASNVATTKFGALYRL